MFGPPVKRESKEREIVGAVMEGVYVRPISSRTLRGASAS